MWRCHGHSGSIFVSLAVPVNYVNSKFIYIHLYSPVIKLIFFNDKVVNLKRYFLINSDHIKRSRLPKTVINIMHFLAYEHYVKWNLKDAVLFIYKNFKPTLPWTFNPFDVTSKTWKLIVEYLVQWSLRINFLTEGYDKSNLFEHFLAQLILQTI